MLGEKNIIAFSPELGDFPIYFSSEKNFFPAQNLIVKALSESYKTIEYILNLV